jgi:phospholipid-binding lipoprotein MlaA
MGLSTLGVFASDALGEVGDGLIPDAALNEMLRAADARPAGRGEDLAELRVDPRLFAAQQVSIRDDFDPEAGETFDEGISDPLEPINRAFFYFNDKLYFWLLKPVATGYQYIFPEPLRVGFRNVFSNLATPVRAVNCLLQGDLKGLGTELLRFVINSTMGVMGFGDAAKEVFQIDRREEDFGQTLGVYGLGPGFYIHWPVFGPSSLRDSFGLGGDAFLDPINYIATPLKYNVSVKGYDRVNSTSLSLGDYESLKKAAIDPYVAVRDAYHQYRQTRVKTRPAPTFKFEAPSDEL